MKHIYLGIPVYESVSPSTLRTCISLAEDAREQGLYIHFDIGVHSLPCMTFNRLWQRALNLYESGEPLDWFVLLHADIGTPDREWLLKMIGAADQNSLDALAAMPLVKDDTGDTSTGLWRKEGVHRLTMSDMRGLPNVLTNNSTTLLHGSVLLMNTGMLLLRLGREWNTEPFFWSNEERMERNTQGKWYASALSEDWQMSLWFNERKIPYGVIQTIPVTHEGRWLWVNEGRA